MGCAHGKQSQCERHCVRGLAHYHTGATDGAHTGRMETTEARSDGLAHLFLRGDATDINITAS